MLRIIPPITTKTAARFWRHVNVGTKNACWLWTASCIDGYGQFGIDYKKYLAHRVALAIVGRRSKIYQTRHICNNSKCCNPSHLKFGTAKENGMDVKMQAVKRVANNTDQN
jgi:hypothetical protein